MTEKKKSNISLILFALFSIFFFSFLIYPLFKDIKKISQELISKKEKIVFLEGKIKNILEFRENYKERKENLEKIERLFVKAEVPIEFINFLEKTAQDSQISIKISFTQIPISSKDPWSSIFFQITSIGSFPNFLKFFEKIESGQYLIEVQNLNISRLTESELKSKELEGFSLGDVKTNLSLKVYAK